MPRRTNSLAERFDSHRQDYRAAKSSRLRPQRQGVPHLGAGADYHYRSEHEYIKLVEQARELERNDGVVGSVLTRSVANMVQGGFTPDPETGDEDVNLELFDRWNEWAEDANACDVTGELCFKDIESLVLRSWLRDGDHFVFPLIEGSLELVETHRCRSPKKTKRNIVHGVELDRRRRRVRYWFTKDELDPYKQTDIKVGDLTNRNARDGDGNPLVLHLYDRWRASQTRGVTAFAPIFDYCAMRDDIDFAKLVQQQVVSVFALIESAAEWATPEGGEFGQESTETLPDGSVRTLSGLGPGMHIMLKPGHKIDTFSPNVPNPEYFQHVRHILQLIGINLGMPLILLLMDASETNFSGWRGAFDQAKLGFVNTQQRLARRFHAEIWRWKVRQWIAADPVLRAAAAELGPKIFRHKWNLPVWPYIEPMKDAQADLLQTRNALNSPRRVQAARGRDWEVVAGEIVADNGYAIELAAAEAERLNGILPPDQKVHWRELISLPTPDGVSMSINDQQPQPSSPDAPSNADD